MWIKIRILTRPAQVDPTDEILGRDPETTWTPAYTNSKDGRVIMADDDESFIYVASGTYLTIKKDEDFLLDIGFTLNQTKEALDWE